MRQKVIAYLIAVCMVLAMIPSAAVSYASEKTTAVDTVETKSDEVNTVSSGLMSDITGSSYVVEYQAVHEYTGAAIKPSVKVRNSAGTYLSKDIEYRVEYQNMVEPGYYSKGIAIIGTEKPAYAGGWAYKGTRYLPVTIKAKTATNISKAAVSYTYSNSYTGSYVKPTVKLTYGGKTLVKDTDYTITYKSIKYPGKYSGAITIKGKGKYTGTVTKAVYIKNPTFSTKVTKVSTSKSAPYIKYNAVKVPGASKITYKVLYKTSDTSAWKTAASATTKTKLTVKGLAKKKAYAVIVTPSVTLNSKTYKGSAVTKYYKITKPSGTAISSGSELLEKINKKPSGKYYLASNITVPANGQVDNIFTGTLDGNGFKISGYKYSKSSYCKTGIFKYAKNATFKNIKMTGVNINIKSKAGAQVGTLAAYATKCKFSNVKVYGKINVNGSSGTGSGFSVGGIAGASSYSTYKNCTNDIAVTVNTKNEYWETNVGGIASSNGQGVLKNCKNTGNIKLNGYSKGSGFLTAGGLIGTDVKTVTSCKNSGNVSVTIGSPSQALSQENGAAGLCGRVSGKMTSSSNTGAVYVKNSSEVRNLYAAGLVGTMTSNEGVVSKCYNKGKVTFYGKSGGEGAKVGGLAGVCSDISQSYNKAQVKSTVTSGFARSGGLAGYVYGVSNSYNVGKVIHSGKGYAGGLAGDADVTFGKAKYNYNAGVVSGSRVTKGAIFGSYTGPQYVNKVTISNNYYKQNIKPYGHSEVTNKYKARATKVSAFKKIKCPTLSSKYWKYSSKAKRLILKNNKEK